MPWKTEVRVEELRREFIKQHEHGVSVRTLCENTGIKKSTAYALLNAARTKGVEEAIRAKSRRPHNSPTKLRADTVGLILSTMSCAANPRWRAKKIWDLLRRACNASELPSISSVHRVLKDYGYVRVQKRNRYPAPAALTVPEYNNHVWCIDHKGLTSGTHTEPLNVVDGASRFWLGCFPFIKKTAAETKAAFLRLFEEFGMPTIVRFDRGSPWSSASTHHFTKFSAWLVACGIEVQWAKSCHQNYIVERLHSTMETEIEPDFKWGDDVRAHYQKHRQIYNEERPHESLDGDSPIDVYSPSKRRYTGERSDGQFAKGCDVMLHVSQGAVHYKGLVIRVGEGFDGRRVGLRQLDASTWVAMYFEYQIKLFLLEEQNKYQLSPEAKERKRARKNDAKHEQRVAVMAAEASLAISL